MILHRDLEIDERALEVRRAGQRLRATPQGVRVLVALAATPGELVTRDSLYAALWPGNQAEVDVDRALNTIVRQLRIALGESAREATYIDTLPGRGYRLTVPPASPQPRVALARAPRRSRAGLFVAAAVVLGIIGALARGASAPRDAIALLPPAVRESVSIGMHFLREPDATARRRAVVPLRAARAMAPPSGFIQAHLAEASYWAGDMAEARQAARRSYQLDPSLPHAQYVEGMLRHLVDWDWAGSARLLDSALASARRPDYLVARAYVAITAGERARATALLDEAFSRSPSDAVIVADLGFIWLYLREPARALELCSLAFRLRPDAASAASCVLEAALDLDDAERGARAGRDIARLTGDTLMVRMLDGLDSHAAVRTWVRHTADLAAASTDCSYWCSRILARSGRPAEALGALERAVSRHDPLVVAATVDPAFASLTGDEDYMRVVGALVRHGAAAVQALRSHPVPGA